MRTWTALFLLTLATSALGQKTDIVFIVGQPKDIWTRTQTLDDSIVEVNTSTISWGQDDIGRVRFRYVYKTPQVVPGNPTEKYKTEVVIVELNCKRWQWRIYQVHYLDSRGHIVESREMDPNAEWRAFAYGFGGGRQYTGVGCSLIKKAGGVVGEYNPQSNPTQPQPKEQQQNDSGPPTLKVREKKKP
jgi:hypothetical protein